MWRCRCSTCAFCQATADTMTATAHISVSQGRKPVWPIAATSIAAAITVALAFATVLPIGALLIRSLFDRSGKFIGGQNFVRYATEPGLSIAAWNSIYLSAAATSIVIAIAFPMAYAFTRSRMPARGLLRVILLLPLLTPSLLPAFGLVYLFGNQGVLKSWLMGAPLYGPIGIIMASVFYALPHALLILSGGLTAGDARQYEAARALRAGAWRIFRTVTLPSARYSIISAASVVFVLVFTDFGIPTVIGGSTNVLATDIYKLVIGRFDFELGAVVGVLLLLPAIVAYGIDVIARRTERSVLSGKSVPIEPEPSLARDLALLVLAALVASAIIGIIAMAIFGSLVKFWPYNYDRPAELRAPAGRRRRCAIAGEQHCAGGLDGAARHASRRDERLDRRAPDRPDAGQPVAAGSRHGADRGAGSRARPRLRLLFQNPQNPLHGLQGTMLLIVICTVAHFYIVPHLMAVRDRCALIAKSTLPVRHCIGTRRIGTAGLSAVPGADAGRHRRILLRQRHDDGIRLDLPVHGANAGCGDCRRQHGGGQPAGAGGGACRPDHGDVNCRDRAANLHQGPGHTATTVAAAHNMMDDERLELMAFAHRLADAAGPLPHFRSGIAADDKSLEGSGFDPVTIADRAGEAAIRKLIERHYPEHGIIGEEMAPSGWTPIRCGYSIRSMARRPSSPVSRSGAR